MKKYDNNRIPLHEVSMYAVIISIIDNERIDTARKGCMFETVPKEEQEPRSANKCSEKDALVEKSGRRNSRFKI